METLHNTGRIRWHELLKSAAPEEWMIAVDLCGAGSLAHIGVEVSLTLRGARVDTIVAHASTLYLAMRAAHQKLRDSSTLPG